MLVSINRHLIENRSFSFHDVFIVVRAIGTCLTARAVDGKTVDCSIAMPPVKVFILNRRFQLRI